jgi:hypothetical protein
LALDAASDPCFEKVDLRGVSLMKSLTLAALALAAMATTSLAQSAADDHEKHHPQQQETAPAPAAPPSPADLSKMGPGMMGDGMAKMMGVMPMADMMRMMMAMMRSSGDGVEMIDHVEGQIAFLRTELKITEAQNSAWNAFADALRANAKSLGELRSSMMAQSGSPSIVDRLDMQEKWLAARLEGTRAIRSALANLAASFSDEQKKAADELLTPHMGMMGTMAAMRSGPMGPGRMQPSQMQPGMMMPGR